MCDIWFWDTYRKGNLRNVTWVYDEFKGNFLRHFQRKFCKKAWKKKIYQKIIIFCSLGHQNLIHFSPTIINISPEEFFFCAQKKIYKKSLKLSQADIKKIHPLYFCLFAELMSKKMSFLIHFLHSVLICEKKKKKDGFFGLQRNFYQFL